MTTKQQRDAFSPAEAAERLGIGLSTIYRAVRSGELPHRKMFKGSGKGGRILIGRLALERWLSGELALERWLSGE